MTISEEPDIINNFKFALMHQYKQFYFIRINYDILI